MSLSASLVPQQRPGFEKSRLDGACQHTITREGSVSGVGIHTGEPAKVIFKPAPENAGIQFFSEGKPINHLSNAEENNPAVPRSGLRCTAIGNGSHQIKTVEHLLAALSALSISNIRIDVEGPEIPALDGSALPFVKLLKELGIRRQETPKEIYRITEPIFCYDNQKAIAIYPADTMSVAYILDYPHPFLRDQKADFEITADIFEKEIAPARTFCTEKEAQELKKSSFGRGADHENTLVIGENGAVNNKLRFKDECARHKVLDIVGDLSLLGFSVVGRVIGIRSGHALNAKLVEKIKEQRGAMKNKKENAPSTGALSSEEIKKILPHRYPFLLVDRIIEMGEKTAVGIKNVSISEPFFQGHFPDRPVMPGVLMIEALAQVGGVLMLSKGENQGKLAYFVSIDKARFRKTVVPGDQLRLSIEVIKLKAKIGVVKGVATVNGEEVCDAEFMFALVE